MSVSAEISDDINIPDGGNVRAGLHHGVPADAVGLGVEGADGAHRQTGGIELRAAGEDITATARGYVLGRAAGGRHTVVCRHGPEDMERELKLMVDYGCTVEDVVVEHSLYGQLTGRLDLSSRYDVEEFVEKVKAGGDHPLSDLTGGIHLHTLRCPNESAFRSLLDALRNEGFLVE